MEYSIDLDIDSSKNSIKRISDGKWMDLLRARYNTNFSLEGPEIIIPVFRENLIIQDKYLKKTTKDPKISSSSKSSTTQHQQILSQKKQKLVQLSLEL